MSLIQPSEAAAAPAVAAEPAVAAVAAAPAVADTTAALTPEAVAAPVVEAAAVVEPVADPVAVARLAELEAAEVARKADVPADAAGYKLEPAEPILDPATGKPVTFDANDPLAKAAVTWAHENGIPQAGFAKLLGVFAANEMAALAAHNATVATETAKLGASHEARFAAVSAALAKHAGETGAKAIMSTLGSADAVIALEAVVKALGGPSIGTPTPNSKTAALDGLSGVDLLSAVLK